MRSRRKLYFTGSDLDESCTARMFWSPARVAKLSLFGVAFVLLIAVYAKYNSTQHRLSQMNYSDQVDYMKRQGATGIQEIIGYLLSPNSEETTFMYLKLVDGELHSGAMDDALCVAQPQEKGDICLVSLALCMSRNPAGIPKFIELIRNGKPGDTRIIEANFFKPSGEKCNPLQRHYGRPDDMGWAFAIIEDALSHTFEGETLLEKRDTLLNWWETNRDGTMIDWQTSFLKSQAPYNRSDAFDFILRRIFKHPEYIPLLVEAMQNEQLVPVKHVMACDLFKIGVREALPVFDEYVRSAKGDDDISRILATIAYIVDLPNEFLSIDTWTEGRDDGKSFAWFREWWIRNFDLMVYSEDKWRCIGVAADDSENSLFD